MTVLGDNIRRCRKALGLTQEALATEAGVGRATISRIESQAEEWGPDLSTIDALAGALKVSRADLLRAPVEGPVAAMLPAYKASKFGADLEPPLDEDEEARLRQLGSLMWLGLEPTLESIHRIVLSFRAAIKAKPHQ